MLCKIFINTDNQRQLTTNQSHQIHSINFLSIWKLSYSLMYIWLLKIDNNWKKKKNIKKCQNLNSKQHQNNGSWMPGMQQ